MSALRICALSYLVCASVHHAVIAKGSEAQVTCTPEVMTVIVPMDGDRKISYLDQMKEYSPCAPLLDNGFAIFRLGLQDPHECGVTRVLNKFTGKQVYYHKVAVETAEGLRETISARCVVIPELPQSQRKRAVDFRAGLQTLENSDLGTDKGHAPEPQLIVPQVELTIKQAGKEISGEISVNSGTPLTMQISLDNSSSPVYGLLVSYMEVTDTREQQETMISNGCSADTRLLDNFLTSDGDTLTANFRAFKFPDTDYVQFKATVSVCLGECQGVPCSNGAAVHGAESDKLFEVSLTTFMKVDYPNENKAPIKKAFNKPFREFESQVICTPEVMTVIIPMDGDRQISYLDQMKGYSPCAPLLTEGLATFKLSLQDPHQCGVTRVLNKFTGRKDYYHKVVAETASGMKDTIPVWCAVTPLPPHSQHKRAVDFPVGFQEPENLEITTSFTGRAPDPQLAVAVKQAGKKVSGEISVNPGTPLAMEISLDNSSAPVYGLLVSYMEVTDTREQQETIIFNGCSVDPYLFDNFLTADGDTLTAKFRAFKFPDTTYVQFKGTVTVCLDKCQGVPCSNGATGFGRKRRAVRGGAESNKVFEVSLTTFIKVDYANGTKEAGANEINGLLKNLKIANQMLGDQMVHSEQDTKEHSAMVHERTQDHEYEIRRWEISGTSLVGPHGALTVLCVTFLKMVLRLF